MTYDIAPVLDHYGQEYDAGRSGNQQVRCVFHEERQPSASVNLDAGLFNCFACGIAGDAIELIKIREGVGFREAKRIAESLAGQSGSTVRGEPDTGGSFLPRKQGHRPGRNRWVSPWVRRRG